MTEFFKLNFGTTALRSRLFQVGWDSPEKFLPMWFGDKVRTILEPGRMGKCWSSGIMFQLEEGIGKQFEGKTMLA